MSEPGWEFVKVDAAGNDLVLVDGRERKLRHPGVFAQALCDRHFGVGGDGLMLLEPSSRAEAFVRMFNPDGTEDFCGNGLRCVAAYLAPDGGEPVVQSPRGAHAAQVAPEGDGAYSVTVDMVEPSFAPKRIPARLPRDGAIGYRLEVDDAWWVASSLSVGTTHTVVYQKDPVSEEDFQKFSARIETHPLFPERTSVLWCVARSFDRVDMRVWERGVGETLACGTGTCAAAVVGRALGFTGDRVTVQTAGGRMVAEWAGEGPVKLTGPARLVFRGRLADDFGEGRG